MCIRDRSTLKRYVSDNDSVADSKSLRKLGRPFALGVEQDGCFLDFQKHGNVENQQHKERTTPKRNRRAKVHRSYSVGKMVEATRLVKQNNTSIYKAAKITGVPWSTLKRYVSDNDSVADSKSLRKLGRPFALGVEQDVSFLDFQKYGNVENQPNKERTTPKRNRRAKVHRSYSVGKICLLYTSRCV